MTPLPPFKTYFFRDSDCLQYDVASDRADVGYPQAVGGEWPGIWKEGFDTGAGTATKASFFKGDQYVRLYLLTRKADDGYPKPIGGNWPGVWKDGIDAVVFWNRTPIRITPAKCRNSDSTYPTQRRRRSTEQRPTEQHSVDSSSTLKKGGPMFPPIRGKPGREA